LLIHFKHIPKEGKHIDWYGFRFEIVDMDGTRIDKVLIKRKDDLDA
jgi:putative hemolysin